MGRAIRLLALSIALTALASSAPAGLYRCVRPDGSTLYTDSQATCPGVSEHTPKAAVQTYRDVATPQPPPSPAPDSGPRRSEAGDEAQWRSRQQQSRAELAAVGLQLDELGPFLTICNRGGELYRTQDNGLRKSVSCSSLRGEVTRLEGRRAELQQYLDHGIREECRKAGCLPGWLR